ncbi:MAG: hypothetical protein A3J07_00775 [Candidatus Doudnabacteria bacterium RIFCSPLOWO2_02_FULL_49_13]|uniref:Uncharacterized protein n=1 Tax=Candidatus Doudnabacteria bacterium RIFCSPHIGHO2_12_FULL_48_16 TaxID=1817838 RepID=A0A1F5PK08_9BACT|nr:MAG: hypothetical protein A3B77_03690 [Candidatus Doudnabacteria bacterium RIFCSPHIGHO2_02_FULL_49_24]OGE88537.1 MAG: hypothetical protein A2760_00425 [Candidatus Doudnabacteria bacterium RIFCSPHIGHO2_01_FULL_50_67]OGE90285.1 MAG: hypothetical protein A3E29_04285 [Candidatus Doudnabacteria bacterium RIFCSPHIGHO2_12_FULL_48_16]OGE96941.1 MAG: hypothetical protein A2990_04075 [Candidatus Doudnabacteria bacterium RIFCSPLOWO2_01_FULL_49_40]OGF02341.1 MAG: hypothetical protein A3J07_00775 [Candid
MTPDIYQPTTLGHTILALAFYVLMAGFVIYSLVALYSLLRFGRSMILAIIVALLYLIISASLYAAAVGNLNGIKF